MYDVTGLYWIFEKCNCKAFLGALCKWLRNNGITKEYINKQLSLTFCKSCCQFEILINLYLWTSSLFWVLIFLPFFSILTVSLMYFLVSLPTSFLLHTFFLSLHLSFFLSSSFFPSRILVISFLTYILITFFLSSLFLHIHNSFQLLFLSVSFSFSSAVTYPFHSLSSTLRVLCTVQEDLSINIWCLHLVFVRRNTSLKVF